MSLESHPNPSFSFSRKWSQRVNVLVGIVSLFAIVVMANYIAVRRYHRFHLGLDDRTQLSPLSTRLVGMLTNELKVVCYFSRDEPLFGDVRELLREYKSASPRVSLEWVDPLRDPGAAEEVKVRYSLTSGDKAFVLFEMAGRTKVVRQADLFEYDLQPLIGGQSQEVKRKDFRGEALFTSAIYSLTSQQTVKAYFLTGLGPASPRDNSEESGYSKLAKLLQANGVDWDTLNLSQVQSVPKDCGLLMVVGPRLQIPPGGVEMLQKYFDGGGRALILFDAFGARAETGWEELLRQFGVRVGFDTVRDPQSVSLAGGQDMQVNHFAKHPITQPMVVAESAGVHLILPRSITPLPRNNTATELTRIDPLFFTSTSGTLHEPLLGRTGSGNGERLLSEVRTNQPMAVAIERGGLPGVGAAQGGTSRMVVVGDSLFLNNRMLGSAANGVFATYAVNWLADRSVLLSDIGPKPYQDYRLSMTRKDRLVLAWVLLGAMPGGVLFLGFMVWLRRRS